MGASLIFNSSLIIVFLLLSHNYINQHAFEYSKENIDHFPYLKVIPYFNFSSFKPITD